MVRVKRGTATRKSHKNLIRKVKGFRMMNSHVFSRAKNANMKAGLNSYISRRLKKRDFRTLWIARLNNAVRQYDLSYSKFINLLYKSKVKIDRKNLSNLAITNPEAFKAIVDFAKKAA